MTPGRYRRRSADGLAIEASALLPASCGQTIAGRVLDLRRTGAGAAAKSVGALVRSSIPEALGIDVDGGTMWGRSPIQRGGSRC